MFDFGKISSEDRKKIYKLISKRSLFFWVFLALIL